MSRLTLKLHYSGQIHLKKVNINMNSRGEYSEMDLPMHGLDFWQKCRDNLVGKGNVTQQMVMDQLDIYSLSYFFFLFTVEPVAYGNSQASGWIGTAAAGVHHSHTGSELHLWSVLQPAAMLDP